ncbi:uncharacterized protein [Epargyreus clarus]|uniref:uncharacterized protein isoform X1 n=1 Tax=Epargyreus clarus TaxID=520877 RepID=UPI003C2DDED6
MPDCSKRSTRPPGVSRNTRSASRPCSQTGSRCTDRQKFCCLSSAEIEGRISRLQEKMRQYNRELRDRVVEISRGEGPMDLVLLTVVEMTTQYERPNQPVNGMANGNHSQSLGDEDLTALISGALNRFRDEVAPNEERPRY